MPTDKKIKHTREQLINKLIPKATKVANEKVKALGESCEQKVGRDGGLFSYCLFSSYFHKAMNEMAIEAGLRVS